MNRPAPFKQADIKRAVAGAREAGLCVARVEIDPVSRKIVLIAGEPEKAETVSPLEQWRQKNGAR